MGNTATSCTQPLGDVTKKRTDRGGSPELNIHYAVSEMKGYRLTMEDKHIHVVGNIPVRDDSNHTDILVDHAIFGVFDGHGGDFTSKFLAANFTGVFSRRDELQRYLELPERGEKSQQDANGVALLQKGLTNTFLELDEQLLPLQRERTEGLRSGKIAASGSKDNYDEYSSSVQQTTTRKSNSVSAEEKSGSTAVVVLVTPSHIICANTGDSRALLRRGGRTLPLSFDHKPSEVPERLRICDHGGFVKGKRVNGDLAVSRAFGDFVYKDNGSPYYTSRVASQQKVIVSPDFVVYPRNDAQDEFIILACDGIWDVASNKQLSEFVYRLLSDGEVDLGNVCEECLDTCLDRQSRDNMTMMLVSLPGIRRDLSNAAALNNALWGSRTARHAKNITQSTLTVAQAPCTLLSRFGRSPAVEV